MQGIAFDEIDHPILNFRKKVFFTRQDVRILTFWPYQMPELPIKQNGLRKHFYAAIFRSDTRNLQELVDQAHAQ